jgi:hypothetical protein
MSAKLGEIYSQEPIASGKMDLAKPSLGTFCHFSDTFRKLHCFFISLSLIYLKNARLVAQKLFVLDQTS